MVKAKNGAILSLIIIGRTAINQEQFTQLYNRLYRFAYYRAGRYFRDNVLREDAAAEAVNDAVDKFVSGDCFDEEAAKLTIQSSLRQSSRTRKLEPVNLLDTEGNRGFHAYKVVQNV